MDWDIRCDVRWKLDPHNQGTKDPISVSDIPEPLAHFLATTWNAFTLGRYYVTNCKRSV